jgi:hypothetical protein
MVGEARRLDLGEVGVIETRGERGGRAVPIAVAVESYRVLLRIAPGGWVTLTPKRARELSDLISGAAAEAEEPPRGGMYAVDAPADQH